MIDFHCHLDLYPDPHKIADEAQRRNIGILSVTTTPTAWVGTARLSHGRPAIRTALGLHPQLAGEREHELKIFDRYLSQTKFVGEVGLDGSPAFRSSWGQQTRVFDHILRACAEAGDKIVSIHSRNAATPVLDALSRNGVIQNPVLHWFSGSQKELWRAINLGCWFSVGPAMLAGAKGRALLSHMPRNRVVLETDGPFANVHRKSLNPWDVAASCQWLSDAWETDRATCEQIVQSNENELLNNPLK